MNLYGYVGNDPVNGTDPTGLECVWVVKDWYLNNVFIGRELLGRRCSGDLKRQGDDERWGGEGGGGSGSEEILASPAGRRPTAQCVVAGGLFVASLALDATLVGGIYVRGAIVGFRFAGALLVGGFGRFAERGAFVKSIKSLDAASRAVAANAASDLTPRAGYIGVASSLSIASGLPTPSVKDFAPIIGTKRAFDTAVAACNE